MYIDTHCHYDMEHFNEGRLDLLYLLKQEFGIGQMIMPAVLAESNETMRRKVDFSRYPELLEGTGYTPEQLPKIWYAAGVHPTRIWGKHAASEAQWEGWIRKAAQEPDTIAIGEAGLDYHHPMDEDMTERQHRWFVKQLQIAEEMDLPLIFHIRMASEDALRVMERFALRRGGVVHCYCEGWDMAQKFLDRGLMLGIGGALTLPKMSELREAVKKAPLSSLLIETDAPYVNPIWELEALEQSKAKAMEAAGNSGDTEAAKAAAATAAAGGTRAAGAGIAQALTGAPTRHPAEATPADAEIWRRWNGINTSRNIPEFVRIIAEMKGISTEKVLAQTNENAARLFRIDVG